jgi:hypothetical protein
MMVALESTRRSFHRLCSAILLAALSSLLLATVDASALQYRRLSLEPSLIGITVTGPIVPGDFDRLRAFLQTPSQSNGIPSFFIDSPGGNIAEAEKIAAYIHETGATVTIPSGSQCSSACFLLFAAAAHRFMAPDALIGVHSVSYNGEENLTTMGFTTVFAREAAACGVPPAIIGKMVQTEPGRAAWLTPADLQSMRVVTLPPPTATPGFKSKEQAEFEDSERRCLATAIYFEARDEPTRGQIALGQIIVSRVRSAGFPETICRVVYQGQAASGCPLPFACDGKSDNPKPGAQWDLAQALARKITSGQVWLAEIGSSTDFEDARAIGHPDLLAKRQAVWAAQYAIEIGSTQNFYEGWATITDMQQEYPSLLASYRPLVQVANLGSEGTWYRLRIGPIDDKEAASKLCVILKARGQPNCSVVGRLEP